MDRKSIRDVVVLWLWFLSLATTTIQFSLSEGTSDVICSARERRALHRFKQGLVDQGNYLSSWTGEACCSWKGIGCDNITRHVVKINLSRNPMDGASLGGEISTSLLDLKHLQYLDLSWNSFEGLQIPEFLGSLTGLRYLNLSNAGFTGDVPCQLGNLLSLQYLDIGGNSLNIENLDWISPLSVLEVLDMSWVDLSKASNWLQGMNMLHSLSVLILSDCGLSSINPLPAVNFSSLTVLDLSENQFVSPTLDWFSSLGSLVSLDLSSSNFHGPIPTALCNLTALRSLHLFKNSFTSTIPDCLSHLTSLESIDFSNNNFHGILPVSIGNLTSIVALDLSNNAFEGEIPRSLGELCNLQRLDLSSNKLVKGLEFLDHGANELSGHFSKCLSVLSVGNSSSSGPTSVSVRGLSSLSYLDISGNSLNGVVSEKHFANLTRLKYLHASSNSFTLEVGSDWNPPFQLEILEMRYWQLGPLFPAWLQTQKDLMGLDISRAGIKDAIPSWFWSLNLDYINLAYNRMYGTVPSLPAAYQIHLGSNKFTGPLPRISSKTVSLDLSHNSFNGSLSPILCQQNNEENTLRSLDLSGNILSGELPDCWASWTLLTVLRLRNNNLTGHLPSSMGSLLWLRSLHMRNNSLSGTLPPSMQGCESLTVVDLSENEFSGSIPMWVGKNLSSLMVLALRSNKFTGSIPMEFCLLKSLQVLDLANNSLSGTIPRCFGNFSVMASQVQPRGSFLSYNNSAIGFTDTASLVVKRTEYEYSGSLPLLTLIDLSCNNLTGEIPKELTSLQGLIFLNLSVNHLEGQLPMEIGAMTSLESLDLSRNKLSGVIPQSLAGISFLSHLNVSYNNFSGRIPSGTQIQSFYASCFIGNLELCGPPLTETCVGDDLPKVPIPGTADEEDDDNWIEMKWFYMSMPLGFVIGFWAVLGPLAIKKAWRVAYFQFLDSVRCKLFGCW
ncbi:LRR receptor-like serine/threonine-protein kinase GSO1 [Vitis vinifera]|uniref:LRR receptor-like serine/threonine-protein kinase GSO1 n=1 Tax=Vitis vinifera TaxID=29760 RepID=A0A438E2G8_VITVI|nr:LRR receptor-like serine/threonine-protein kinase GSO1 [Vitis vinifera]RVX01887.1 LRR receptor-like serine/threonine-protein kinase GSO1 [Vitis vinifera]